MVEINLDDDERLVVILCLSVLAAALCFAFLLILLDPLCFRYDDDDAADDEDDFLEGVVSRKDMPQYSLEYSSNKQQDDEYQRQYEEYQRQYQLYLQELKQYQEQQYVYKQQEHQQQQQKQQYLEEQQCLYEEQQQKRQRYEQQQQQIERQEQEQEQQRQEQEQEHQRREKIIQIALSKASATPPPRPEKGLIKPPSGRSIPLLTDQQQQALNNNKATGAATSSYSKEGDFAIVVYDDKVPERDVTTPTTSEPQPSLRRPQSTKTTPWDEASRGQSPKTTDDGGRTRKPPTRSVSFSEDVESVISQSDNNNNVGEEESTVEIYPYSPRESMVSLPAEVKAMDARRVQEQQEQEQKEPTPSPSFDHHHNYNISAALPEEVLTDNETATVESVDYKINRPIPPTPPPPRAVKTNKIQTTTTSNNNNRSNLLTNKPMIPQYSHKAERQRFIILNALIITIVGCIVTVLVVRFYL